MEDMIRVFPFRRTGNVSCRTGPGCVQRGQSGKEVAAQRFPFADIQRVANDSFQHGVRKCGDRLRGPGAVFLRREILLRSR